MGCCQSGFFGGPPSIENHPLLTGETKTVPPLIISQETTHQMDRESTANKQPPPRIGASLNHSTSSPRIPSGKPGSSSSLNSDPPAPDSPKPTPRKEPIKRSLTMSAGAVTAAPLLDQMNQKFARSITDLPVASDIPRMAGRTTVYELTGGSALFRRSEGLLASSASSTPSTPSTASTSTSDTSAEPSSSSTPSSPLTALQLSKGLILCLFNLLTPDNKRLASIVGEKFDEVLPIDYEGDSRDRLNGFLDSSIGNESPVGAVLKCINQGLVAPAIMALRIGLMGKVNYKDCGNNWDVEVRANQNSAIVVHLKREQTVPSGCEFLWRLEMHFTAPFTHIMHVNFNIVDVSFTDENMETERKIKLVESLSAFFTQDLRDKFQAMSPTKIGRPQQPREIVVTQYSDTLATSSSESTLSSPRANMRGSN